MVYETGSWTYTDYRSKRNIKSEVNDEGIFD